MVNNKYTHTHTQRERERESKGDISGIGEV